MSRWLIELIAAALMLGGGYAWWIHHDHVEQVVGIQKQVQTDKAAADKQKAIDDKVLADTKVSHATEIDNLKKAYQDASLTPVAAAKPVVCYYQTQSSSVSEASVHSGTSTTPVVVQDNSGLYSQRAAAFELLLKRADGLSADARQLEQQTHAGH